MKFLNQLSSTLSKYFVYLVLLIAAVAMLMPSPFLSLLKVRILGQSPVSVGIGIIMFIMGLTMRKEDFKIIVTQPKDILVGCLAQFTVMPFLAYFLAKTFHLPAELAVGLVLLGTCPGGTASNVMTYLAKGDVALSIGMTTASTLLAPLLTPFLTYFLAGEWVEINVVTMIMDILKIVIGPVFLGLFIHNLVGEKVKKIENVLVMIPIVSIVLVMGMCVAPNKNNLLNSGFVLILAVCLHNWFGFLLGYLIGNFTNMNLEKKKALSIEVGLQNSGLTVGLSSQFSSPLVALPAAIATVVHQLSGAFLANLFSKNFNFNFMRKKIYTK